MGTGQGGLKFVDSARVIFSVVRDEILNGNFPNNSKIDFSLPKDLNREELEEISKIFDDIFPKITARIKISDADFRFDRPVEGSEGDRLDRIAIAEAIEEKVIGVWRDCVTPSAEGQTPAYPAHPFIVHLAGAWGSGKSSILNFLKESLRKQTDVTLPPPPGRVGDFTEKGWVVIEFNAWRHQKTGHAWWALMTAVTAQAPMQIGARGSAFRRRDWWWRAYSSWRNWIVGGLAVVTLVLFWSAAAGAEGGVAETMKTVAGLITGIGAIVAFASGFSPRSERTANAIKDLEIDPTAALKRRYEAMIREIHNPVAILIDDLDRCDAAFVVELLQAIQTVYADVPALYVVAADRQWIVSAYDQSYSKFSGAIGEPGLPLGYLFVKKIFQLSVNVPDLGRGDQRSFLRSLLPQMTEETATEAEIAEVEQKVEQAAGLEAITELVGQQTREPLRRAAGRAALRKLMTPETTKQAQHLLLDTLAPEQGEILLDPNPRAITRLVNAYSFRLGYALRAGALEVVDKLPYWCVLDLRYPLASKRLAEKPELAEADAWKTDAEAASFPEPAAIGAILAHLSPDEIRVLRGFG